MRLEASPTRLLRQADPRRGVSVKRKGQGRSVPQARPSFSPAINVTRSQRRRIDRTRYDLIPSADCLDLQRLPEASC